MTLGSKLRAARQEANLTQQQLATKLMVSRQAITKWETGAGIPDIENLKALAALFGVSVDYLVAGDEPVSGAVLIEPVDLRDYAPRRRARLFAVEARLPDAASSRRISTARRGFHPFKGRNPRLAVLIRHVASVIVRVRGEGA